MPSLSSLLSKIPDEFQPMAAIGLGALILIVLVLFHGVGLHRILLHFKRVEMRLRVGRPHLWRAGYLFGWAVFMMLSLHILEIIAWAFGLLQLGLILRPSDAIYYCANAYTTLGYGSVDLGMNWRNISPIIAISGLFTFAWTTSSLVNMVTAYLKLVEQLEVERVEELSMRAAARKAVGDVLSREKAEIQANRQDAGKRGGTLSFMERRNQVWKEEKEKEKQLRDAARTEVRNLIRQERLDEDKLGKRSPPPDHPQGTT